MTTKRGIHPDDMLLPLAEIQRRRQWRAQDPRQKEASRGTEVTPEQQDLSLNLNIRGNANLPLPSQDLKHILQSQKKPQSRPETPEQDLNNIYGCVRSSFYSHFSKTIAGQYKKATQKIAEQHWLDEDGNPKTTIIKDPSRRLRRRLEQKLHPEAYRKRPQLPKDYQEQARQRYPSINEPLSHLLYLHDNLSWNFDDIAYRLASSPQQIEHWYWSARLLNIFHQRARKLSSVS